MTLCNNLIRRRMFTEAVSTAIGRVFDRTSIAVQSQVEVGAVLPFWVFCDIGVNVRYRVRQVTKGWETLGRLHDEDL